MSGRTDWQERVGVGERQHRYGRHAGGTKTTPVMRDDNGKPIGHQTEHWSGRVDATVTPPPIKAKSSVRLPGQKD